MIRSLFCFMIGICIQLPLDAVAQPVLQLSGTAQLPHICFRKINSAAVREGLNSSPALYLLVNDSPSRFPVAGTYTHSEDRICFEPLYPLAEGAQFLLRMPVYADTILKIPYLSRKPTERTTLLQIYPQTDAIPKNILFFHLRFSQAMKEDKAAWEQVHVIDDEGKLIPRTWRQRSFWLDSGRLLVLMIHPGRVKNGIHYTSPVFEEGRCYTLVLDSTLTDINGQHLSQPMQRTYTVLPAQTGRLKVCQVSRRLREGTQAPIQIHFCKGVDHAAAISSIRLFQANGDELACSIEQVAPDLIVVKPKQAWQKQVLQLELGASLYDYSGNRINRNFEMRHKRNYLKDQKSRYYKIRVR